jgi:thiamine kinase-like enzyme
VERLGRGLVNETHRVLRDGRLYSLRMPAAQPAPVGVDREWECRVLAVATAAGIAPVIERCEPGQGVLVARWEAGRTLDADAARQPEASARVARLAHRVHALVPPANARTRSAGDWIRHYREALMRPGARGLPADAQGLAAEAGRRLGALPALSRAAGVLCHSDLHPANLVASERGLVLLDWEYAHIAEPLWDLAGWACNVDLEPQARAHLLGCYLGRMPAQEEERRLADLAWLYDYVCLLWSAVYCGATDASDRLILERGRLLTERLVRRAGGGADELPAH